jgi:hypothetical protein
VSVSSSLRDPKSFTQWMKLDYFRHPRRLLRVLRGTTWAALLVGVVALALALWPASHPLHQAGPLSSAHAVLGNDCRLCHEEFLRPAERLLKGDTTLRTVSDAACKKCHDGPIHKEEQSHLPPCASCHREHRGRARLTQTADLHCTSCHADLRASMKDPGKCRFENVSDFATDHPEFALWRKGPTDPGTIAFNHFAHLRPEGTLGPGRQKVNLTCSTCHKPDAERRYFQPIRYVDHCAACHPLAVQVVDAPADPATTSAAAGFARDPAPHDRPVVVRAILRERYSHFARDFPAVLEATPAPAEGVPARPGAKPRTGKDAWVDFQTAQAERMLFDLGGGCRFCHQAQGPRATGELPVYAPSRLLNRWFTGSQFRHESHHVLRCTECHGDVSESRSSADVLMPKIGTCRQCHTPAVGARSDCVECHRYHDRTKGRGQEGVRTIDECTGRAGPLREP